MTEQDLIIQSLRRRVDTLLTERNKLQQEIEILKMQVEWLNGKSEKPNEEA